MNLGDAIRTGADAIDARKKFDPEVRAQYMNASEAGTCIRKQWYNKNGAKKDKPEDWGYARRGTAGEAYMVSRLQAANVPMCFTGEEQLQLRDDERMLSCTPDGLVWDTEHDDGWIAVEFKTVDPRVNRAYLPKEEHITQVQLGAALMAEMAEQGDLPELGGHPIKYCKVVYMCASNFNDITEHKVPRADKAGDRLAPRASRLLKSKSASKLPREGVETRNKSECKQRCPFNAVCGVDGAGSSTGQGKKDGGDLTVQVNEYVVAKTAEEEAKARKTSAGELVKAILQRNGMTTLEVDGHVVKLGTRAGSISYAKVVKDHCSGVDLEPYRGAPSETLTVK